MKKLTEEARRIAYENNLGVMKIGRIYLIVDQASLGGLATEEEFRTLAAVDAYLKKIGK